MTGFCVRGNDRAAQSDVGGGDIEFGGTASECGFHYTIDAAADDAFERAGHADVALEGGAIGEDALVGGGDVSMGAKDCGGPAVEVAAHKLHFAGGFGVEIDESNADVVRHGRKYAVGGLPRVVDGLHEQLPEQAGDSNRNAVASFYDTPIAADRFGREVRGFDDVWFGFEDRINLFTAIDVVAQCNGVETGANQFAVDGGSEAGAAGGVFSIGYDKVEIIFGDKTFHGATDDVAAGFTYDVTDEEEAHGWVAG